MKTPTGTSETAASSPPKKRVGPFTFFAQVQQEARKVTWTSRQETIYATIMTLVMVVVAAAFFYMADALVTIGVRWLTGTEAL
ncbi:MAG TPA: preprotein translocase subunit SecE [Hyphomonadaceae bacterium]|jgi:preprotein translocase subunit SecE|nr:preprotein translocase subunit SecE [Hyphomonadaceae bacterium]